MVKKIGSFVIDVNGKELTSEDAELLAHPLVGGVILFARNYESPKQISALCQKIRASRNSPVLIMVDQEGGQVQRFIDGFSRLPRMAMFGKIYDKNAELACELAKDCGWVMAAELLAVGVDLSLAPVADLHKGINIAIGERAFHADPEVVVRLTSAFIQGMQAAGMSATIKHFPGHGSVASDSHQALPIDERALHEIEQSDMLPFAKLIQTSAKAVMAAHIVFPKIDTLPVSFSAHWLRDILRARLGFTGIIFSDDLNMKGANISSRYADRFVAAKEAGCDFILLCNNRAGVIEVLDSLSYTPYLLSEAQWGVLQGRPIRFDTTLANQPEWQKAHQSLQKVNIFTGQ